MRNRDFLAKESLAVLLAGTSAASSELTKAEIRMRVSSRVEAAGGFLSL
jgi:hypothetical protein